jgi:hypothetical protein
VSAVHTPPTLRDYLRAAKRKHSDPEAIFETAAGNGFTPIQLARVVEALRSTHPGWRLRKRDRDPLVAALLDVGKGQSWVADSLGCHPRTVRRCAASRKAGVRDGFIKPPKPDKTRVPVLTPTRTSCGGTWLRNSELIGKRPTDTRRPGPHAPPILSFDASSGADLTLGRHRELLDRLGGP